MKGKKKLGERNFDNRPEIKSAREREWKNEKNRDKRREKAEEEMERRKADRKTDRHTQP